MSKEISRYEKGLPIPDEDSQPFWQAARDHRLVIQRCVDCGRLRHPPQVLCPACWSSRSDWRQVSGRGKVYTFAVVRHAFSPSWAQDIPYVVAIVELEEGVRLFTNIVGCEPDAIRIGTEVEVVFDDVTDAITLPRFRPAARAGSA